MTVLKIYFTAAAMMIIHAAADASNDAIPPAKDHCVTACNAHWGAERKVSDFQYDFNGERAGVWTNSEVEERHDSIHTSEANKNQLWAYTKKGAEALMDFAGKPELAENVRSCHQQCGNLLNIFAKQNEQLVDQMIMESR